MREGSQRDQRGVAALCFAEARVGDLWSGRKDLSWTEFRVTAGLSRLAVRPYLTAVGNCGSSVANVAANKLRLASQSSPSSASPYPELHGYANVKGVKGGHQYLRLIHRVFADFTAAQVYTGARSASRARRLKSLTNCRAHAKKSANPILKDSLPSQTFFTPTCRAKIDTGLSAEKTSNQT